MNLGKISCIISFSILINSNVYAEMYKWIDDDGTVQYSQSPPVNKSAEVIKPPPKIDTESAVKKLEKRKEAFNKADEEKSKAEEEAQKKAEELALKESNCKSSKSRLNSLQNSRRIRTVDEDGNIGRATDEEHQARIKESKANVAKWCN